MRTRQLAAAAALLTVVLAATGCDPEDASDGGSTAAQSAAATTGSASSAAAPSAAASKGASGSTSKAAAAPAGGEAVKPADEAAFEKGSLDPGSCASFYKTHKILVIESLKNGQLKAYQEKVECGQYGRQLDDPAGDATVMKVAPNLTVTVLGNTVSSSSTNYPHFEAHKVSFADFVKSRKPCDDFPDPDDRPADASCDPLFVYETDGSGTVTSLHETWEPTD
ncbi:hypothetical protein [Kitasatospora sp. NPDC057198]|uniref:hypothetical protein n=1 Tax=Kitasatospora sp. NPDC057198 TaxID=3346046 RepID=UPI0036258DB6